MTCRSGMLLEGCLVSHGGGLFWATHLGGIGLGWKARARSQRLPDVADPDRAERPFHAQSTCFLSASGQKWGAILAECPDAVSAGPAALLRLTRAGACATVAQDAQKHCGLAAVQHRRIHPHLLATRHRDEANSKGRASAGPRREDRVLEGADPHRAIAKAEDGSCNCIRFCAHNLPNSF